MALVRPRAANCIVLELMQLKIPKLLLLKKLDSQSNVILYKYQYSQFVDFCDLLYQTCL